MFQFFLKFEILFSKKKTWFCFGFWNVLAQQIWDIAQNKKNPSDFAIAIDESELGAFSFTDEFIFDLWAAIDDIKVGRIKDKETEDERL